MEKTPRDRLINQVIAKTQAQSESEYIEFQ